MGLIATHGACYALRCRDESRLGGGVLMRKSNRKIWIAIVSASFELYCSKMLEMAKSEALIPKSVFLFSWSD